MNLKKLFGCLVAVGLVASTPALAGSPPKGVFKTIRLPHGTAPSTPVDGEAWSTTTAFFIRVDGATKTLADLESAQTFTGIKTFTGVSFGSNVVTGIDLSKHIALYSNSYGINITSGRMNMHAQTAFWVVINQTDMVRVDNTGLKIAAGSLSTPIATKTADYTVANADSSLIFNCTGTCTITLPAASSHTGRIMYLRTIAAQSVISASSNVIPLIGGSAGTAILDATAGKWVMLQSDGTNWQIMAGN